MELICLSVNSCIFCSSDFMLLTFHIPPTFSSKMKNIGVFLILVMSIF